MLSALLFFAILLQTVPALLRFGESSGMREEPARQRQAAELLLASTLTDPYGAMPECSKDTKKALNDRYILSSSRAVGQVPFVQLLIAGARKLIQLHANCQRAFLVPNPRAVRRVGQPLH